MSYSVSRFWCGARRLAVCTALLGCGGSQASLKPAPTAQNAQQLKEGARTQASGVTLVAEADVWSGDDDVKDHVTPVHVILENHGEKSVRVQYRDFCLVNESGTQFAALPPFEMRQGAVMPTAISSNMPIDAKWKGQKFELALAYAPIYSQKLATARGPLDYDVAYYNEYYRVWSEDAEDLPNQTMQQKAIPEGILEPGGSLDGFLFFQDLPSDVERVVLRADVVDADSNETVDTLQIPFIPRE